MNGVSGFAKRDPAGPVLDQQFSWGGFTGRFVAISNSNWHIVMATLARRRVDGRRLKKETKRSDQSELQSRRTKLGLKPSERDDKSHSK